MLKLLMGVLILFMLTGCDDKDNAITDIATVSDANASADIAVTETNISTGTNDKHTIKTPNNPVAVEAESVGDCDAEATVDIAVANNKKVSDTKILTDQSSKNNADNFDDTNVSSKTGCDKDHTTAGNINVSDANTLVDITIASGKKISDTKILTDQISEDDTDSFDTNTSLETNDEDDAVYGDDNSSLIDQDNKNDTDGIETNTSSETSNRDDNSSLTDEGSDIAIETNLSLEPYYHQQWYLENNKIFYSDNSIDANASIHAGEMLKRYTGRDVTIAVIDDGVDVTHEELNGSIVAMYDIETNTTNVSHIRPSSYHGTAVTGIIAANLNDKGIVGIARESDIIFLKYKEGMSDSETIELFNKAEELGADIINCSWGTYDVSPAVKETIQKLAQDGRDGKGIIIVFAVGNNDQDMGNDESAIPEVIAVGSTDRDNLRAWYSNYGEHLDILAPGGYEVGITTLDPMGTNGIGDEAENYLLAADPYSFIGTSASAPIVTGAIALLLEKDPELTRVEIEELLKNRSDKIGTIEYNAGHNIYYGYGKINVGRLLGE